MRDSTANLVGLKTLKRAMLSGICAAALSPLCPAAAQEQAQQPLPQGEGAAAAASDTAVEEIIVTAQKRAENVQNVPIAITALSADQLRDAGVASTLDLKATVPALNFTTATGGIGLPRIRGIGATGQGPGIENPVAVYVDGVYYGASFGVLQSLYDIEQVSVLKGPQGTLFGRNATGGLIQITTAGPSFDWKGKAEVGFGNYNTASGAAYVTGGLSESVAVSLSGQYEKRADGFGTNIFTGSDVQDGSVWAARAKLLWKAGEDTSFLLSGDFNGRNASEPAFRNFSPNSLGQNVTQQIVAAGGDPDHDINADIDPDLSTRQKGGSLTITHEFGGAALKSITAYRKSDFHYYFDPDGTTLRRIVIDNTQYDKQFTQEVNLVSSGDGPFKWVLGGFYMDGSAGTNPGRTSGLLTLGGNGYTDTVNEVKLTSLSGFAEGTYAFGGSTNFTAGVRYTSDKRDLNAFTRTVNTLTNVTTTSATTTDDHTFNKLTWRLSLDHRFSPDLLVYASYNRGFRSGTYIAQATPIVLLNPEVVDAYEIGLKSDLADRRVRLNVAGYYYDEKNIQVQQVISGVNSLYNADGAHIYGIDADITWRVTSDFRLFGGFNWTHARYTNFPTAIISVPFPLPAGFVIPTGQTCLGTFGSPAAQLGGNCLLRGDASGNKLQNTPSLTFSLGGSFDIPTSAGTFTLAGNYYYNDGYVGTTDERVRQPHYNTVDASLTWRHPNEKLFARVWGKNLTDEFYRTQIGATNSGDNGTNAAPRTYGVTVGVDF